MTDFQKLVQALEQAKVPCNVTIDIHGSISVECGTNWPEEMFFQISDIAAAIAVPVSVCASVEGGIVGAQQQIAGGPKHYYSFVR
jgi:hypothetical protein